MQTLRLLFRYAPIKIIALAAALVLAPRWAHAEALLLVEADTGKVLEAQNATYPWYPASVTKLMTAYVTLKAVKDGRITLDTLFTVSPTAASQSPSKMGYRPGTQVTVDNALKMMLVKSANDMAVVLAEGVGGSIDGFSAMMNDTARKLGMTQTSYVNPNGLPADGQITSARDLAILARAIIRDLPEYEYFVHIPSIRYGRRVVQNFNKLIGRYPGADGFKTGFICASGYNLVASATRNGKRLIAVVLGASSGQMRAVRAIQMLDRGFNGNQLSWLKSPLGTVDQLPPVDATPPNLRDDMCNGRRHRPASDDDEDTVAGADGEATGGTLLAGLQTPTMKPSELLAAAPAPSEPVLVYTGPTRTGAALIAAVAADADAQTATKHRGKKAHAAARKDAKPATRTAAKTDADAKAAAKPQAKPAEAKPGAARHVAAKHEAGGKTAEKAGSDAPKPTKPKAAAKPKTDGKPAPKDG
ncbi:MULTISPECIES: D-alanyl-D-alanine carboxypeptidase family protein [unclassified Bradyrhizobium]|uniref:D-alanyl-D-alanine carboxypeptidase family protein n=1 Tax=unclassified Bradyrhizobium TaxID=2631580 RepID=UPI00291657BA|nr:MULTISPECIES: D-alanyl-D-alanine carboxypeptidase family protein [unclassified Bradyrhizobium]